jgi:exonuclease III
MATSFMPAMPKCPPKVAWLCIRLQPKAVISGLGFETADRYGRYLQADFDKVSIATLLLPSGMNGDEDLNQKFKLMDDFARYLDKQRRTSRVHLLWLAVRGATEAGYQE